jgi:hypothetical protein
LASGRDRDASRLSLNDHPSPRAPWQAISPVAIPYDWFKLYLEITAARFSGGCTRKSTPPRTETNTRSSVVALRTFRTKVFNPVQASIRQRHDVSFSKREPLSVWALDLFPRAAAPRAIPEGNRAGEPFSLGMGTSRCGLAGAARRSGASEDDLRRSCREADVGESRRLFRQGGFRSWNRRCEGHNELLLASTQPHRSGRQDVTRVRSPSGQPASKSAQTSPLPNMQHNMQWLGKLPIYLEKSMGSGGDEGIRTLETVPRLHP